VGYANAAKRRGLKCGVSVRKACSSQNLDLCSSSSICLQASYVINGQKKWRVDYNDPYAKEAKRRGLSCGVTENISLPCGDRNTKACSNSVICNYATKKELGVRKWETLPSFAPYVAEAKRRNLSCSVKQPATIRTCYTDISVCSETRICRQATKDRNGKAMWDERPQFAKYVSEAKRRGLSCGITTAPSKECSRNDPENCSPSIICAYATTIRTGSKIWESSPAFVPFVNEAKRRGLSCEVNDVQGASCVTNPKKCNQSVLCDKATLKISGEKKWNYQSYAWVSEAKRRSLSCGITEAEAKTKTYYNMSIIGNDLIKDGYYNTTEFLCAELCRSNPKCEAVSFHLEHRSCWLKPSMVGIKRLNGVNTTEIFR
jgi:hypothetical protein